ncbi:TetR/AcrR family transcriptional regulator [Curtobacterium sp. VKM Ac-2887]|uniref:TetR/AcrR family transcriptional regulator n=1 Tax=Curtobacterium sp. VKM Ac-2887 TaxID=2783819 RepID=UPI00188B8A07|nr:TetR/AcrR family transcriptional regulator [Curtobacterium sp. VKM Ac-2887]MBF4588279.1 TetR/AcrR family transcriptional regulator [Curtobacterium sp. VKM Ac-2887]
MRSDTERNRARIIKAASRLAAKHGNAIRMQDVAEKAEVSTATAYRHFGSVDDALAEFRFGVGETLREFSIARDEHGLDLLEVVSARWIELVMKHGRAMVHTRSDEGYLKRLRSGATYLTVQADALERPIREAVAEAGIDDPGDLGLFFWNALFDPREIFDLHQTVGLTADEMAPRLVRTLLGALRGWAPAT